MNLDSFRSRLKGPIASLVTPFDQNGQFSPEGLRQEILYLLAAGIRVLVCNGSIGEFSSLTTAERKQVLEITVKHARDKALVLTGCASSDVATVLELSDHAASHGADGLMLTAPYYFKSTSLELHEFFRAVDHKVMLPWVVYNNPATTKVDIPLDLIPEFTKLKHFAALKESSGDMVRYYQERQRFASVFPIIAAAESVIVFQLLAGAEGVMTAAVDFAPGLMTNLWVAASQGRTAEAFSLFSRLLQLRTVINESVARGFPSFVAYTKAGLEIRGVPAGPPRIPLLPLSLAEKAQLAKLLAAVPD